MRKHTSHRPGKYPDCPMCMAMQRANTAPQRRELTDEEVQRQAEVLSDFVARGGAGARWLSSKKFAPADRTAILVAYSDMD